MAKIHDLFIIELAEVIKGYGNDPDVEDPFRLSEFYRFYELPNIAVSRENFEKMRPAQQEIIRCKDCRHRIVNDHYGEKGYLNIKGYCELDTADPFELGRDAQNDDWFCADAERRTDG